MVAADIRIAVRALLTRPGFTIVAVVTMALGIGANAAVFSVVDAVLLRPLPYNAVDRLVRVTGNARATGDTDNLSPMDFLDLRSRTRRLAGLAAFNNYADATLTGAGDPERIAGTRVSADFLSVLGVTPAAGRDFRATDDEPDSSRVAILTNGFWRRRFAGDPAIVGRIVSLNSVPTEIIGVLPPSFRHPFPDNARQPDVLVPFRLDRRENNRGGHYLQAIGRLQAGATMVDAQADLQTIAADLERAYPASDTGRSVMIRPLQDAMVGAVRPALLVLLATVVLVLLIACSNLVNLFLARATSRRKELAVRQALGCGRLQLMRPLIVESLLVAAAGWAIGLAIAAGVVRVLIVLGADRIPRGETVTIDLRVAFFAFALSLAAAMLFGVVPALRVWSGDLEAALRDGGRSSGAPLHRRAHSALVVSEMALALILLVTAGLLIESLWRLERVDPGFRAASTLTLQTSLPLARYAEGDEIPFYQQLEARLARLPGVERVGAVQILPFSNDYSCDGFEIAGRDPFPPGQEPCAEHRTITPGYFEAMQIPLLNGRVFDGFDVEGQPGVAIVSDAMARRFWPRGDAIGGRIVYQKAPRAIVGIVAGVRHFGLDRDVPLEMYTPHAQQPSYHTMTIVLRTPLDAASLMPAIRRELSAIDHDVPISEVRTMEQLIAVSTTEPRFRTTLVAAFATLALLLAIVGVAGVIAYTTGRRQQEIGVRVALGATSGRVTRMVLVEGLLPTLMGVAIGVAGALAMTRMLSGLLFGAAATDPIVFAGATVALVGAALLATLVPARRAAAVDPMIALRAD